MLGLADGTFKSIVTNPSDFTAKSRIGRSWQIPYAVLIFRCDCANSFRGICVRLPIEERQYQRRIQVFWAYWPNLRSGYAKNPIDWGLLRTWYRTCLL